MFVVTTSASAKSRTPVWILQKTPQASAWGYTDEARLRGLKKSMLLASDMDDLFVGIP